MTAKQAMVLIDHEKMKPCLEDLSPSVLNTTGQMTMFINEFQGETQNNDSRQFKMREISHLVELRGGQLDEAGQMKSFVDGPQEGPQGEKLHNDDDRLFSGKDVSKWQMVYATPSQIDEYGYLPVPRCPMHSETHNELLGGPQQATLLSQHGPFNSSHVGHRGMSGLCDDGIVEE